MKSSSLNTDEVRRVFYNDHYQKDIEKNGFVVIPLLSNEEADYLLETHKQLAPDRKEGFYTSIWHEDEDYRKAVNKLIADIIPGKLKSILMDYKPVFANFMVKKGQQKSSLDFHQDWTFVDESNFIAVNVWVPLQDTFKENGALQVVKGSHLFNIPYRGRNIEGPYWHLSKYIRMFFAEILHVRKGHAVIFDERLIHGSFDNLSGTDRIAVSNVMVPAEAPILHFLKKNPGDVISKMQVKEDFFTKYALNDDVSSYGQIQPFHFQIQPFSIWSFAFAFWKARNATR